LGNVTERHLCEAYDAKAAAIFTSVESRAQFWSEKLRTPREEIVRLFATPPVFQSLLRSKTMKQGGVGYVQAESDSFPRLADVNRFAASEGAIPTLAWLDGLSEGERDAERLLDIHAGNGTLAINIIPDRNWNVANSTERRDKVARLDAIVAAASSRGFPIFVGTEMNAYGQRFVDDFAAPEMVRHVNRFLEGASILYAHTRLEAAGGMGYASEWARARFSTISEKNAFYRRIGEGWGPDRVEGSIHVTGSMDPETVLAAVS
jgi:hypothetical protein